MAKNPNPKHSNVHTLYCATSGGGKSQALGQNKEITNKSARIIFWDTHNDFKADRYQTIPELLKALKAVENKKGGFRIAYAGQRSMIAFNQFCRIVWAFLDGRKVTYVVVDELADVVESIAKDKSPLGELLRGGRKFGLRIHCTATRAAEIPKTVFTQCKIKYIGSMDSVSDAKTMSDFLMIDYRRILDLNSMEFFVKQPNKPAVKYQQKGKKPPL